ncbi:MAG: hypothetical protein JST00_43465 [Deltaproteobacteria bacterium]|nr:hypothetical protein [Deltaproteobacteria bacterium]
MKTATRMTSASAMIIGLDGMSGGVCFSYFDEAGMRIIASRTVSAALQRMAEAMPGIVVMPDDLPPTEIAQIEEHALAVGAVLAIVPRSAGEPEIRAILTSAIASSNRTRTEVG